MYETHFGLLRRPFLATPDPDCFVPHESADNALVGLRICVEGGKGFGILSAPAGTGKTLLCRKLIVDLRDRFATVFLANSNFPTRRSLLQAILYELGHPYMRMAEQELRLELKTAATKIRPEKEAVLLVVDEAHLLGNQLLDELRTAANIDLDGTPLIHVVLSGQLELEEKLIDPDLAALNQRVGCQETLESMTREESAMYVAHRLQWAGADVEEAFQGDALAVICHAADGLPRCLNQLCDHSLLLAYVADERPVSEATVREALEDLKQLPLHWNEPAAASSPLDQLWAEVATHEATNAEPDTVLEMDAVLETDAVFETDAEFETDAANSEPAWEEFPREATAECPSADVANGGHVIEIGESVIEVGETASVEVGAPVTVESEEPVAEIDEPVPVVFEVGAMESVKVEPAVVAQEAVEPVATMDVMESTIETIEVTAKPAVGDLAEVRPSAPELPTETVSCPSIPGDGADFVEEVVVDRYARLDAGLPIRDSFVTTVMNDGVGTELQAPAPAAFLQTTTADVDAEVDPEAVEIGCDFTAAKTPEQLLDLIEPLISDVLNDDRAWDVESMTSISQTIVGPPLSLDETECAGAETGVQESEGLVDWVDDHVRPDVDTPTDYDVVQPDMQVVSEESQLPAERVETPEPKFPGRYAQLFSKLRRRQQRSV